MKIFVLPLICVLVGRAAGSVQAWGSPALYSGLTLKTIIPPKVKGFAYSTSQYFNAAPSSVYSFGLQPQFAYQVPSFSGFAPAQSTYYPVSSSIYPASVFFPAVSGIAPGIPAAAPVAPPQPSPPSSPDQGGSADTTVVESAGQQQAQQPSLEETPSQSNQQFTPGSTFPSFPSIPQIPQLSGPNQEFQPSFPQFPQLPDSPFPGGPGSAPPSFLGDLGGDKGINDEDTVSVESA